MAVSQTPAISQLPGSIATAADVGRLQREVEAVDNFLRQAAIRQPGSPIQMPRTSKLFDELVTLNKVNVLVATERQQLSHFLESLRVGAPILHFSFNADPSPNFSAKLVTWIRQNIHPFALLQIGLQPTIGAGCVVRSTNKYFDFSLRQHFASQRPLLISKLKGVDEPAAHSVVTEPVAATVTPAAPAPTKPA